MKTPDLKQDSKVDRIAKKDQLRVRTDRRVNFLLALAGVLVFSWIVLESYTAVKSPAAVKMKHTEDTDFDEEVIDEIFVLKETPVKQQPVNKPVVKKSTSPKVAEPIDKVLPSDNIQPVQTKHETLIQNNKSDESQKNDNQKNIESSSKATGKKNNQVNRLPQTLDAPFVSFAPVHPDCAGITDQDELVDCFQSRIERLIKRRFDTSLARDLYSENGTHTIYVRFVIDSNGRVGNIETRSKYEVLSREAKEVISRLPQFTPGKQNGNPVNVRYALPITISHRN